MITGGSRKSNRPSRSSLGRSSGESWRFAAASTVPTGMPLPSSSRVLCLTCRGPPGPARGLDDASVPGRVREFCADDPGRATTYRRNLQMLKKLEPMSNCACVKVYPLVNEDAALLKRRVPSRARDLGRGRRSQRAGALGLLAVVVARA